jgi:hypothetical protein
MPPAAAAIARDRYDAIVAHFSEPPTVTPIEAAPVENEPF